jgi:Fic family protein
LEWLEYFLVGVRNTAHRALADTSSLVDTYQKYRTLMDQAKRVPGAAGGILDAVFGSPMLSIKSHSRNTGESYPNVAKGVAFWEKHGLLTEITQKQRNKIYAASEILELARAKGRS